VCHRQAGRELGWQSQQLQFGQQLQFEVCLCQVARSSQKGWGKLVDCALEINCVLDPDTSCCTALVASTRCRDFGMDKTSFSGDGVVTGSGLIAGRPVFVYSQDFTGGAVVGRTGSRYSSLPLLDWICTLPTHAPPACAGALL
jgi:hypothetical protein